MISRHFEKCYSHWAASDYRHWAASDYHLGLGLRRPIRNVIVTSTFIYIHYRKEVMKETTFEDMKCEVCNMLK